MNDQYHLGAYRLPVVSIETAKLCDPAHKDSSPGALERADGELFDAVYNYLGHNVDRIKLPCDKDEAVRTALGCIAHGHRLLRREAVIGPELPLVSQDARMTALSCSSVCALGMARMYSFNELLATESTGVPPGEFPHDLVGHTAMIGVGYAHALLELQAQLNRAQ